MQFLTKPLLFATFGLLLLTAACKKDPLVKNDRNTILSINDVKLVNLMNTTSIDCEFKYEITVPIAGTTRDTVEVYKSPFKITNVANQSQEIYFNLPDNVKSVKASCSITILDGIAEKMTASSFRMVTNGVEKINKTNIEADFSSDYYLVGPYTADF